MLIDCVPEVAMTTPPIDRVFDGVIFKGATPRPASPIRKTGLSTSLVGISKPSSTDPKVPGAKRTLTTQSASCPRVTSEQLSATILKGAVSCTPPATAPRTTSFTPWFCTVTSNSALAPTPIDPKSSNEVDTTSRGTITRFR